MTDLETRRTEAETKLAELRQERGSKILDGKKPDIGDITEIEHEIEGLADAEGEAAEAERKARRADLAKQLSVLEAKRLGAIQDANMATRALIDALGQVIEITKSMAKAAHGITGAPVPVPLQEGNLVSRMAGRLSAVMASLSGHRNRFGAIEWRGASLYRPSDNWREQEAKLLEGHLRPLIEKE